MKIIGKTQSNYIAEVNHAEIEKFMGMYYGKMDKLDIGEEVNLGKGYDFSVDISSSMNKTQEMIKANKKIINSIINGIQVVNFKETKNSKKD